MNITYITCTNEIIIACIPLFYDYLDWYTDDLQASLVLSRHDVTESYKTKIVEHSEQDISTGICYTINDVSLFRIHVKLCWAC